jgi:tetratricopeptide (TPR) repeat protein
MKGERPASAFPAWTPLALLIGLTVAAYLPSLANGFIWDDDASLTQNPFIRSGEGLHDFWVTTLTPDYWPVTATTLWAEWRLWGMNPFGYHVTNLALHVAEVLLLWTVLRRLRIPGATLAALLFALHPVNVETVAWITQRKNLMAMLFFLLAILAFLKAGERLRAAYWLSLLALVLGMLSKGSVAVLPVVLLGLIAWRRPLRAGDFLRVAPFFAVAGVLTLVDIWFQGHHLAAAETIRRTGGLERLLGAGAVVWFYLSKAMLPIRLILPYPLWRIESASVGWWLPLLAALALTGWLWHGRRAHALSRGALFAWGYFCVALVPVMGFTDVYFMKFSLVADHYQHLALIGITTLAGAGWAEWHRRDPGLRSWAAAVITVGLLGALTWQQGLRYRDTETFFEATLRQNPDSAMAHNNLGMVLGAEQRPLEAMTHFMEALRLEPDSAEAHSNIGAVLIGEGRAEEGMAHYRAALRIKPDLFVAHLNLGNTLLREGRLEEAGVELQAAVRLKPAFPEAHELLGDVWFQLGRGPEAIREYEAALRLRPDYAEARVHLERALGAGAKR